LLAEKFFQVVTTDSYHSAIAKFAINAGEQELLVRSGLREPITLPLEYAEILARQFTSSGLTITVNSKRIIFANREMKVELPALQSNTTMLQHALQLAEQFKRNGVTLAEADKLLGILNNLKVIGKTDQPLLFTLREGDKSLIVSYTTPSGRMADQMTLATASERNKKLRLEPHNLYDIAGKLAKGDAAISYNKHIIRLSCYTADLQVDYYSSQLQKS
jgi:hypothetical protein